ncbi:MAG: glycosyltransferase family 4 protein [archaeon]
MRVALLSPRTPRAHAAGIEQNILHVSQYLLRKGVSVEVFSTAEKPRGKYSLHGIPVREFSAFAPADNYFFSIPLFQSLKKWDGNIIHCNGYNNLVSVLGITAKKKGQKLVFTLNSSGSSSMLRGLLHIPLAWFYRIHAKKIDHLVCVSRWEYEKLAPLFGLKKENVSIIPNGISLTEFAKKGNRKSGKIVSVGRLVKNKGMHRLINAFGRVHEEMPETELHIVGDGPARHDLEQQVHAQGLTNAVFFHGNIGFEDREKLLVHYRTASVFSLLTDYESQGIVFAEAAAAELPMVIPDKGVMHEYVEAGLAQGVKNVDDSEEVARALIHALRSKPSAAKLKSLKFSKSFKPLIWDWEEVGEAVHQLYQHLVEES